MRHSSKTGQEQYLSELNGLRHMAPIPFFSVRCATGEWRFCCSAMGFRGLCGELPPMQQSSTASATRPDIDFFFTTLDTDEALQKLRTVLIALARRCEETEIGMCVVRSPYAVTIAMDDCDYDLQIVLSAFDSMEDVLSNFDIDACRVGYDGTRLVASQSFLRALVSGVIIARPGNESSNHAKRLHKYATLQHGGFAIAIADFDPNRPGRTPTLLNEWESAANLAAAETANPDNSLLSELRRVREARRPPPPPAEAGSVSEWEVPFTADDVAYASIIMRTRAFGSSNPIGSNPALYTPEDLDPPPAWGANEPPEYEAPLPRRLRLIRSREHGGVSYSSTAAREVIEVWRGQRRHPHANGYYAGACEEGAAPPQWCGGVMGWRFKQLQQYVAALGTGSMRRSAGEPVSSYLS